MMSFSILLLSGGLGGFLAKALHSSLVLIWVA
jgi:hypothetical protein